jgi:hypothetical protein
LPKRKEKLFLNAKKIRTLEIDVKNYRNWSKNYFRAVKASITSRDIAQGNE